MAKDQEGEKQLVGRYRAAQILESVASVFPFLTKTPLMRLPISPITRV